MVKTKKIKNNVNNLKTVSINNLSHFYGKNENKKQVLNDVNLNIDKGELVPVSYTHMTLPTTSSG